MKSTKRYLQKVKRKKHKQQLKHLSYIIKEEYDKLLNEVIDPRIISKTGGWFDDLFKRMQMGRRAQRPLTTSRRIGRTHALSDPFAPPTQSPSRPPIGVREFTPITGRPYTPSEQLATPVVQPRPAAPPPALAAVPGPTPEELTAGQAGPGGLFFDDSGKIVYQTMARPRGHDTAGTPRVRRPGPRIRRPGSRRVGGRAVATGRQSRFEPPGPSSTVQPAAPTTPAVQPTTPDVQQPIDIDDALRGHFSSAPRQTGAPTMKTSAGERAAQIDYAADSVNQADRMGKPFGDPSYVPPTPSELSIGAYGPPKPLASELTDVWDRLASGDLTRKNFRQGPRNEFLRGILDNRGIDQSTRERFTSVYGMNNKTIPQSGRSDYEIFETIHNEAPGAAGRKWGMLGTREGAINVNRNPQLRAMNSIEQFLENVPRLKQGTSAPGMRHSPAVFSFGSSVNPKKFQIAQGGWAHTAGKDIKNVLGGLQNSSGRQLPMGIPHNANSWTSHEIYTFLDEFGVGGVRYLELKYDLNLMEPWGLDPRFEYGMSLSRWNEAKSEKALSMPSRNWDDTTYFPWEPSSRKPIPEERPIHTSVDVEQAEEVPVYVDMPGGDDTIYEWRRRELGSRLDEYHMERIIKDEYQKLLLELKK